MRRLVVGPALALVAVGALGARSEPPAAGVAAGAGAPIQRTTVVGTAPFHEGRWLLLVSIGEGGGRRAAALWEVTRGAAGLELRERFALLPHAQRAELANGRWTPARADLQAIAQAWDTLEPDTRNVGQLRNDVFGQDGFTAEVTADPTAKDALWVVRQTYAFAPGPARPVRQVNVIAGLSEKDGIHRGRYLSVTFAAVPVPIPIKIEGTFELIPLPGGPASFWARLLDVFRGCNPSVP